MVHTYCLADEGQVWSAVDGFRRLAVCYEDYDVFDALTLITLEDVCSHVERGAGAGRSCTGRHKQHRRTHNFIE